MSSQGKTFVRKIPEHSGILRGGEGEIRTLDNLAAMPDFESGAFDHSATSPYFTLMIIWRSSGASVKNILTVLTVRLRYFCPPASRISSK